MGAEEFVVDMGFAPQAAARRAHVADIGGATGGAIFGLLATRIAVKQLTLCVLLGASVMIAGSAAVRRI